MSDDTPSSVASRNSFKSRRTVSAAKWTSRDTLATVVFAACVNLSFARRSVCQTACGTNAPASSSSSSSSSSAFCVSSTVESARLPSSCQRDPRVSSPPPNPSEGAFVSAKTSSSSSDSESRSKSPALAAKSPTRAVTFLKKSISGAGLGVTQVVKALTRLTGASGPCARGVGSSRSFKRRRMLAF